MRFSSLLPAAIASLAVVCATVAYSAPPTDVVFGNLGASGTDSVGPVNIDIGPTTLQMAQGFTAASPNLTVQSVGLWLFGEATTASVSIYDATAIIPPGGPGDPVATSSSLTVGAKGLYQFTFSGLNLTNGTNYWVVPNGDVSWYLASGAPTEQNASGYAFTSALERPFGGQWTTASSSAMSVSITAVPEPSTYALAGIGVVAAGLMRWRRRQIGR